MKSRSLIIGLYQNAKWCSKNADGEDDIDAPDDFELQEMIWDLVGDSYYHPISQNVKQDQQFCRENL